MLRKFLAVASLAIAAATANATTFRFDTDPFAGTPVLNAPGRQIVGGEQFLSSFSLTNDVFSFDAGVFHVAPAVGFADSLAANLPASGVNVVVLQDTDNDANPLTPFGAGNAADLIAAHVTQSGPGFFIYMNSSLNLRRLVYSTDLSSSNSDLRILARILDPQGPAAVATLPGFQASNFQITPSAVPEPSSLAMLGAGLALLSAGWRRRSKNRR